MYKLRTFLRRYAPLRSAVKKAFPLIQWLNHKRTVIKTVDGVQYELCLNELIDSNIYYFGVFEPYTVRAIQAIVKPGQTVFDVGANIGCHTLLLSKMVGSSGRVFAFEPMGAPHSRLMRNLSLNTWTDNVTVEKTVLGNSSGHLQASFRTSWPLFGQPPDPHKEWVECATIDG